MKTKYPPTPGEIALAGETLTLGGETEHLTNLSHAIALSDKPIVRVFREGGGPPLEQVQDNIGAARSTALLIERVLRLANGTAWPVECHVCGERETGCFNAPLMRRLVAERLCFGCNYWVEIAGSIPETLPPRLPRPAVIEGRYYVVKPMSSASARLRGFGGMHRRIEWHDGFAAESNDMWNGSEIPELFRSRLPDNARFAGREEGAA